MFEDIDLNESKNIAKSLNVVIYGSIRNIAEHFVKSFTNIDLLCNFFNNVYIIIFENDSTDHTRDLLINWSLYNNPNTKKHILLENNLDIDFPLRAHRLSYCRNKIINYIFDNNLHANYQYAIHCDLDDRLWSLDYNSIMNCFQYDLNSWDAMFPINKNYSYYDYWALRCSETWFNKNIFSCKIENNDDYNEYEKHIPDLLYFFKNSKNNLINVSSAFNGIGIYKLSSIENCRYNANYYCSKCDGKQRGCFEDNDHIGFHKSMIFNNCKLYINKKMILENKNEKYINYSTFIKNLTNIPNINKDPLKYVLYKKKIDKNYVWLNFSKKIGNYENTISNFTNNKVFSICIDDNDNYSNNLINNNVITYFGNLPKNICNFILNNEDFLISFIHIDFNDYHYTKEIFEKLYKRINNDCFIIINKFLNFDGYLLNDLHAFYEFTQRYNIQFKYIGINGVFSLNPNNVLNSSTSVAIKIIDNPFLSKIEITSELYIYEDIYINFDWEKYIKTNTDLINATTKEEAWKHWLSFGKNEGRKYFSLNNQNLEENYFKHLKEPDLKEPDLKEPPIVKFEAEQYIENNFDWQKYINNYIDLANLKTQKEAWDHWINYGKDEGRQYFIINEDNLEENKDIDINFDWQKYINNYIDLANLKTQKEAWDHWINYGKDEGRQYFIINEDNLEENKDIDINFDWQKYINNYSDLANLKTQKEAWDHLINHGKDENRRYFTINQDNLEENKDIDNNFDWQKYINNYSDLANLKTQKEALDHWINYGKDEGRKYFTLNGINLENIDNNFNWQKYIKINNDLTHLKTREEAWDHWINHGKNEGRKSCFKTYENFNWKYYIENNEDLSYIKTKEDAWDHWINYGKNEGRNINDNFIKLSTFDWKYYIENNPDLINIKTKEDAWNHWKNYGKNENRLFKKKNKKNTAYF
jgi:hypothetical protein